MGVVYRGFDPDIERYVAIKTLHPHIIQGSEGDTFLARFKREAQIAASCVHPNIVMILEYGNYQKTPFIVMEYVEGKTVSDLLKKQPHSSVKNTVAIVMAVLKALNAAHKHGIVHRDIKPANIMLANNKQIKLADFGIARIEHNSDMTMAGAVLGTPRYMAPEQLQGKAVDSRADLYALAMVMVELLARSGESHSIPLMQLTTLDASVSRKLGQNLRIPSAFVSLIEKALKSSPNSRFKTAAAFADALKQAYITHSQSSSTQLSPSTTKQTHLTQLGQAQHYQTQFGSSNSTRYTGSFLDIDLQTIHDIEADLITHIGDSARGLVKNEVSHALSLSEVIYTLAQRINADKVRNKFIKRWTQ